MPAAIPIGAAVAGAVVSNALQDNSGPQAASEQSREASAASAAATTEQTSEAKNMFAHYQQNFQPLEANLTGAAGDWLAKAGTYGTPEEQEKAAGVAHGDVTQAYGRARDATRRSIASYGINPNSGRFSNMELSSNLDQAKADVLAQNTARQTVKDTGFQKSVAATGVAQNIAAIGRGIPASASTALGSAATTDNAQAKMQFDNAQTLANQQRQGMAPIVNAVSNGVTKWWQTPSASPAPVDQFAT